MKKSLRKRYLAVGLLLIIGFLSFLLIAAQLIREPVVRNWNKKKMESVAEQVIAELGENDWNLEETDLETLAFENNVSITVVDEKYCVLSSTRLRESVGNTLGERSQKVIEENQQELADSGHCFYSYFDEANKASFVHVSQVESLGYVLLRKSISGFNNSIFVLELCFIIASVLTLAAGGLILYWLTGRMARPIREISRVTGQIADLNFDEKARVDNEDELGELAQSVNRMSVRLKETMESLRQDVENRKLLIRNMAHELKTPTAVIMGYAENMPAVAANPQKLERYCSVIVEECTRMDSLIRQMLAVSSAEAGNDAAFFRDFPAEDLLKGLQKRMEDEFPGFHGSYEEKNEICRTIRGNRENIRLALYNLAKNAAQYGKSDGRILVHLWEDEGFFHFGVYDEGSFIPEEEQEKIWNVFYKLDSARTREQNSFGVGLSIVRQTALAHGGGTAVRNLSDGVEVEFFIPAAGSAENFGKITE